MQNCAEKPVHTGLDDETVIAITQEVDREGQLGDNRLPVVWLAAPVMLYNDIEDVNWCKQHPQFCHMATDKEGVIDGSITIFARQTIAANEQE